MILIFFKSINLLFNLIINNYNNILLIFFIIYNNIYYLIKRFEFEYYFFIKI